MELDDHGGGLRDAGGALDLGEEGVATAGAAVERRLEVDVEVGRPLGEELVAVLGAVQGDGGVPLLPVVQLHRQARARAGLVAVAVVVVLLRVQRAAGLLLPAAGEPRRRRQAAAVAQEGGGHVVVVASAAAQRMHLDQLAN